MEEEYDERWGGGDEEEIGRGGLYVLRRFRVVPGPSLRLGPVMSRIWSTDAPPA